MNATGSERTLRASTKSASQTGRNARSTPTPCDNRGGNADDDDRCAEGPHVALHGNVRTPQVDQQLFHRQSANDARTGAISRQIKRHQFVVPYPRALGAVGADELRVFFPDHAKAFFDSSLRYRSSIARLMS